MRNAIAESQLEGHQYKLTRGDERYGSARTRKIMEKETQGMREEISKGGTN